MAFILGTRVVYSLYAVSGFSASLLMWTKPFFLSRDRCAIDLNSADPRLALSEKSAQLDRLRNFIRYLGLLGMFLLAFMTASDNARTVAGTFDYIWPDGIYATKNSTLANQLVAIGNSTQSYFPMLALTCTNFFAHEVLGALLGMQGLYLLVWGASRNSGNRCCMSRDGLERRQSTQMPHWRPCEAEFVFMLATVILTLLFCVGGLVAFIMFTASQGWRLDFNEFQGNFGLKPVKASPIGLIGVFYASFCWILACALLRFKHGYPATVFLVIQVLLTLGQAASSNAGKFNGLISNFFEQAAVWSLLFQMRQMNGILTSKGSAASLNQNQIDSAAYTNLI
jgi:hypothetical protein